ncbi:MAG: ABC transporter permease [Sphingobacteriales bacterium]
MIKNYFKVAVRNLLKRKVYSLINILGLATGMAICLLIVLFIKSELSFDKSHKNGNNIYRLVVDRKYPGRSTSYSNIPQSYAYAVKQEFPEVKEAVRIYDFLDDGNFQLKYEDKTFEEKKVLIVDSNFFRVFSAIFINGNGENALNKPNAVVMTETTAKKYFGSVDNAVEKILQPEGNNNKPLEVTAVCKDWPENSHFTFDMLLTTAGNPNFNVINYVNFTAHTYLLLNENASPKALETKFPHVIEKYASGDIEKQFAMSFQQFQAAGNGYHYYLQPLTKIHLISHLEKELKPNGSLTAVYIFSIVAVFILLIACINFINLSTARSSERAKEVGIRKTFGSEKKSLIIQFLTESTLVSITGMLLAIGFAFLLLPLFNQLSGKDLELRSLFNISTILILFAFTLLTGLVAGLYPAFILSSFRPIQVLRGKFKTSTHGLALRNGLVVFQFAISVILIICTVVVNTQMKYMTSEKLGFNKEHTIIIERTDLLGDNTRAFKNEVRKISGVENLSGASALPGQENFFGVSWQEKGSKEPMTGRGMITDDQYQSTLGLQLKEGRFFSKDFPTDSLAVVLNEKAVTEMGLKTPVGASVTTPEEFYNGPNGIQYTYTVIGVVKDFHYQSLHQPITPLVFTNASKFKDVMFLTAVRVKGENFKSTVEAIEKKWNEFVKDRPFHYEFLDKTIAAQYKAEATTQKIFTFFSSLAIFIACIGLLGLTAYSTQQRIHEIGVRKVLGASVENITGMLSKDFMKLVAISVVIAFPVAWYAMHQWLQDFTYRINIAWWMFVGAGAVALLVALITISFQAIKAAVANPIKSLRTE